MRIIAGQYRSRSLRALRGMDTRPTSDRLRETLFNVLTAGNPAALQGSVWLDIFAGTGAVGIEAISRGASQVYFIESGQAAARIIRQNLESLEIEQGAQVVEQDATAALKRLDSQAVECDYCFLDPPYRLTNSCAVTLGFLGQSGLVHQRTTVIAEHSKRFDPGEQFGALKRDRKLVQGDACLSFYRRAE